MFYSIVIPSYNRADLLMGLLDSLERIVIPEDVRWEVVVVDNNSTDSTREKVQAFLDTGSLPLRCFIETNQGSSHARNRGVKEARGDIIAFLDDDEIADESWLQALHRGFERHGCAGIGGRVVAKWVFPIPGWYTTEGPYRIVGPTAEYDLGDEWLRYSVGMQMPVTANFSVRRECFEKYGYFRTDMGPVGDDYIMGEDAEFCMRLVKGGEKLVYSPEVLTYNIVHRDRVSKQYCKRYHFRFGRVTAQFFEAKESTRMYWGIPRYLFREYVETLLLWATSPFNGKRRTGFYYRLKLSRIAGEIYEHVRRRIRKRAGGSVALQE